jgi:hypothetical protein
MPFQETDAPLQAQMTGFRNALDELGRPPDRAVQLDERWAGGDFGMLRRAAGELVALQPMLLSAAAPSFFLARGSGSFSLPF